MIFALHIHTDNAAFEDDANAEIARILREAARHVEGGTMQRRLHDMNGNTVGRYRLKDGDDAQ